jgi:hypothetical protein
LEEQQQMYLQNKYTTWYFQLIAKAQSRIIEQDVYTEKHHIIPKGLGNYKRHHGNNCKLKLL